jgi:hypothetical protein
MRRIIDLVVENGENTMDQEEAVTKVKVYPIRITRLPVSAIEGTVRYDLKMMASIHGSSQLGYMPNLCMHNPGPLAPSRTAEARKKLRSRILCVGLELLGRNLYYSWSYSFRARCLRSCVGITDSTTISLVNIA